MDTVVYCFDCGEQLEIEQEYYDAHYDQPTGTIIKVRSHDCENHNAELEERIDELEDLLRQIKNWCRAYPLDIAREPTKEETKLARKILKDAGMSLSLFMISAMRRVTTGIADEILKDVELEG